jgi:arabinofuranosyltransferase
LARAVPHVEEGWAYLVDFVTAYWLWLPVSLLALWAGLGTRALPTPQRVALAVLPAAGALHALYIVRAGGDYIHARLLLLPLFTILAPVATVPVRRSWAAVPMVAVALWALVSAGTLRNHGHVEVNRTLIGNGRGAFDSFENPVTAEDQGWGKDSDRARRLRNHVVAVAEQELDVSAPSGLRTPAVALHGVGVSGYSLGIDVYVVDRLGLGDPLTSRFRLTEPGFIAHEKPIPRSWLAARLSTGPLEEDDLGLDGFASPLYESPTGRFDHDTAVARTVLACRPLRELREATTEPLTLGRALSNLWRAPGLTRLQVAPSPEQARSELC